MKNSNWLVYYLVCALIALVVSLVSATTSLAQTDTTTPPSNQGIQLTEEKLQHIENNLVRDLENPSIGVCIGGAQAVRDLKGRAPKYSFSKVIIPLMGLVKNEKVDRAARILGALALFDLDDARGNFAIAREAEMSGDELFKNICANLAKARKVKDKK